jgi:hypothetical protein
MPYTPIGSVTETTSWPVKNDDELPNGNKLTNDNRRICDDNKTCRGTNIWEKLSICTRFDSQRVYPSAHQLDYVQKYLAPISSEFGLQHYMRETLESFFLYGVRPIAFCQARMIREKARRSKGGMSLKEAWSQGR